MPRKPNNGRKEQSITSYPRIGVSVLITKDDQVLLMKRRNAPGDGTWSTVSGYLRYRESFQECAIREAQEVTNVHIADVTFLAITNDMFDAPERHDLTIWMAGRYVSGESVMQATQKLAAADWFAWDALPEPLFWPFEHLLTGQCFPAIWDFSGGNNVFSSPPS